MKAKICNEPSCHTLISQSEIYCNKHKKEPSKPFSNAVRSNEGLYNTSRWRKLKKKILSEQPYCSRCGLSNKEVLLHVHHKMPARGNEDIFFDESNLEVICEHCHRIITNIEINNRKYKQG